MEKEHFGTWTVTCSRDSGGKTKPMGMEFTRTATEQGMKGTGKTTCSMDLA